MATSLLRHVSRRTTFSSALSVVVLALVPAAVAQTAPISITGFVATFDQSQFTTTYVVTARGKNLAYKWAKAQTGKTCGLFETDGARASWRHPHRSQADPKVPADKWCEDSQQAGGHKGTITVVVTDGSSTCTQAWPFGSLSSQEVREAGGDAPKPVCTQKSAAAPAGAADEPPDLTVEVSGPKRWPVKVATAGLTDAALTESRQLYTLRYDVKVRNDGPGRIDRPFLTVSFFDGRGRPVTWAWGYYQGFSLECEPAEHTDTQRITCRADHDLAPKELVRLWVFVYSSPKDKPGSRDSSEALKRFTKRGLVVKASVGTSTRERTKANNNAEQKTTFVPVET